MTRLTFDTAAAAIAGLLLAAPAAQAQQPAYPAKPVRVIQSAAPGGSLDIVSRRVMSQVTERYNQAFVFDARGGASGAIGVDLVAKSTPDGYTLLAAAMSHLCTVPMINKVPYDTQKDLAPIAEFGGQPYVLAVTSTLPASSVKDLITLAKSRPGALNYGSGGVGTSDNLSMELFKLMAGVNVVHIPYKGTGETIVALMGGQVDMFFGGIAAVAPYVKSGRVRMLGITSLKRSAVLPDLPTIAELGVPGFEAVSWYGLLGPRNTPPSVISALNREVNEALNTPALRDSFLKDGADVTPGTPGDFQEVINREIGKWSKLLKDTNLKQ
jgi:tripartite-type tricarboxylate transporter receptor subunit TctC